MNSVLFRRLDQGAVAAAREVLLQLHDEPQRPVRDEDAVVVIGSTLSVYPAAFIPLEVVDRGHPMVIVNRGETDHDFRAAARVDGSATFGFEASAGTIVSGAGTQEVVLEFVDGLIEVEIFDERTEALIASARSSRSSTARRPRSSSRRASRAAATRRPRRCSRC